MNYITYRHKLYKLKLRVKRFERDSLKDIDDARKRNDKEKIAQIETSLIRNDMIFDDERHKLITQYLVSECEKRCLAIPQREIGSDYWACILGTDKYHDLHLSKKGITELRELLRKDSKERFESIARWVTIIIGLIGAITGLVAVWQSS